MRVRDEWLVRHRAGIQGERRLFKCRLFRQVDVNPIIEDLSMHFGRGDIKQQSEQIVLEENQAQEE